MVLATFVGTNLLNIIIHFHEAYSIPFQIVKTGNQSNVANKNYAKNSEIKSFFSSVCLQCKISTKFQQNFFLFFIEARVLATLVAIWLPLTFLI